VRLFRFAICFLCDYLYLVSMSFSVLFVVCRLTDCCTLRFMALFTCGEGLEFGFMCVMTIYGS